LRLSPRSGVGAGENFRFMSRVPEWIAENSITNSLIR
jgi:hypothetical protein